jgi:hypothetical protein
MRIIKTTIRKAADIVSFLIGNSIPKKRNLILFHGATLSSYNESTRYLYEYMLVNNQDVDLKWITDNKVVFEFLSSHEKPVVFHKSVMGLICYLRAGIVIGTGTSYPSLLEFVGNKTLKICLHHGVGPRSTNAVDGYMFTDPFQVLIKYRRYDYFNFTSKYTDMFIGKMQFLIPDARRVVLGLPRCDHLLDSNASQISKLNKHLLKKIYNKVKSGDQCVLYAPTWRPYNTKMSFPLEQIDGFNIYNFNKWLIEKNILFFVSVHPIVEEQNLDNYSNILYLNTDHLVDINMILPEIDLLVTDYSSIATDYMLLDRPVIYVMHDYDYFLYEYGLLEDFRGNLPGSESHSMDQFKTDLDHSLRCPEEMADKRSEYITRYYDTNINNSCERVNGFVNTLLK